MKVHISRFIKSRIITLAGYVVHMEERWNACKISVIEHEVNNICEMQAKM